MPNNVIEIESCGSCIYFKITEDRDECHRNPPGENGWPECDYEEFCGEYKPVLQQCEICKHSDGGCYLSQEATFKRNEGKETSKAEMDKQRRLAEWQDNRRENYARRSSCPVFEAIENEEGEN